MIIGCTCYRIKMSTNSLFMQDQEIIYLITFNIQQLRYLELQHCLFHPPLGFKGFEKLDNLHLMHVTFDPSILTNLISTSPLLEQLRLRCCTNFDNHDIDAFFEFTRKSKFISFHNAPMLEKVTVCFIGEWVLTNTSPFCSNLTKFFHYTSSLRKLNMCGSTLEVSYIWDNWTCNFSSMSLQDLTIEFVSTLLFLFLFFH